MIKSATADERGHKRKRTRTIRFVSSIMLSPRLSATFPRWSAVLLFIVGGSSLLIACSGSRDTANETRTGEPPAADSTLFTRMPSSFTGVHFANRLTDTRELNVFTYRNFYNGGGVAIGDLTGDGCRGRAHGQPGGPQALPNEGQFRFRAHPQSGWPRAWHEAVDDWRDARDVNGDGRLDIYICHAGNVPPAERANALWINEAPNEDSVPSVQRASACVRHRGRRICDALRLLDTIATATSISF